MGVGLVGGVGVGDAVFARDVFVGDVCAGFVRYALAPKTAMLSNMTVASMIVSKYLCFFDCNIDVP